MASTQTKTNHWVDELFPPTFNLNSSFDLKDMKCKSSYSVGDIQKIYEDVYLSEINQDILDKSVNNVHRLQEQIHPNCSPEIEKKDTLATVKPVWTNNEIAVLRKSLKRSKLNNIRLSVQRDSLQKDCEYLQKICKQQTNDILKWSEKYNKVKRQNKRTTIVCCAFKEDAKKFFQDFEESQKVYHETMNEKQDLESSLVETQKNLDALQKECNKLSSELEKQRKLEKQHLKSQKETLELFKEKEIIELLKRLDQVETELENEKNEHKINKKALEHLRLHFTTNNV